MDTTAKKHIKHSINQWVKYWNENSGERLASLYFDECVFYATLGDELRYKSSEVKKYFNEIFRNYVGTSVVADPIHWSQAREDVVTVAGKLLFRLADETSFPARVIWVFLKNMDSWKIHCHHSSLIRQSPFDKEYITRG